MDRRALAGLPVEVEFDDGDEDMPELKPLEEYLTSSSGCGKIEPRSIRGAVKQLDSIEPRSIRGAVKQLDSIEPRSTNQPFIDKGDVKMSELTAAQKAAQERAQAAKAKVEAEATKARIAKERAEAKAKADKEREAKKAAKEKEAAAKKAEREAKKAEREALRAAGGGNRLVPANLAAYHFDKEKKTAGGNISVDCGDKLAEKLRGASIDTVYLEASKILGEKEADLRSKYTHLNLGMQRMNLGNRMRAAQAKGH